MAMSGDFPRDGLHPQQPACMIHAAVHFKKGSEVAASFGLDYSLQRGHCSPEAVSATT